MGMSLFSSCSTNYQVSAPNPNKFKVLKVESFENGTEVIKAKYEGCTTFEGVKIMVFPKAIGLIHSSGLDPHFSEDDNVSPIARFRPTKEGWKIAVEFAAQIDEMKKFWA
jgi:hypothetical protein